VTDAPGEYVNLWWVLVPGGIVVTIAFAVLVGLAHGRPRAQRIRVLALGIMVGVGLAVLGVAMSERTEAAYEAAATEWLGSAYGLTADGLAMSDLTETGCGRAYRSVPGGLAEEFCLEVGDDGRLVATTPDGVELTPGALD
jgi:hypothetical protein